MQVSLITPHPDEKGDEHGNVQLQRQETSSQKLDQPGKVLQQGGNDQRNAGRCKHVKEQVQGSVAKKNDQSKHTYNQRGVNLSNQINQASVEYHNNFPKISNNYSSMSLILKQIKLISRTLMWFSLLLEVLPTKNMFIILITMQKLKKI